MPRPFVRAALGASMLHLIAVVACVFVAPAAAATPSIRVSVTPIAEPLATTPTKATVTVKNAGKRRVSGLALSVKPAKGVKLTLAGAKEGKRTRTLKSLRPGQRVRVTVRVRRTTAGPTRGSLRVEVTRRGKTVVRTRLRFGGSSSLAGRYFYRVIPTGIGTTNPGIYFTTDTTAFRGAPPNGVPECDAPTVSGDADGCISYRFEESTGALTVAGRPATVLDGGHRFELDGVFYLEAAVPAPGQKLNLVGTGFADTCGSGVCGSGSDVLKLDSTGRFGEPDTEQGAIDGLPPDRSGSYTIGTRGRLTLDYADGTRRAYLLALPVYPNPSPDFQPDPAVKGFLLDSFFMYGPQTP